MDFNLSQSNVDAFYLTFQLALVTVACLMLVCTPIAWWLARSNNRFRPIIEAVIALPLVLPPTVIGFYLLLALGPNGPFGWLYDLFGIRTLNFTFAGLVIGSMIYSLPFVVQPLQQAFKSIEERHIEVAATLGASSFDRFFSIILPMAKPGYLTALVLGFAHTLGEFGVVLMIGGNIPSQTQVVSIAIYEQVEMLDYSQANLMSMILLVLSFCMLFAVYSINRKFSVVKI